MKFIPLLLTIIALTACKISKLGSPDAGTAIQSGELLSELPVVAPMPRSVSPLGSAAIRCREAMTSLGGIRDAHGIAEAGDDGSFFLTGESGGAPGAQKAIYFFTPNGIYWGLLGRATLSSADFRADLPGRETPLRLTRLMLSDGAGIVARRLLAGESAEGLPALKLDLLTEDTASINLPVYNATIGAFGRYLNDYTGLASWLLNNAVARLQRDPGDTEATPVLSRFGWPESSEQAIMQALQPCQNDLLFSLKLMRDGKPVDTLNGHKSFLNRLLGTANALKKP